MIQRSPPATLDDLYRVEGKAELIGGRIKHYMASGDLPSLVAFEIAIRLREYAEQTGCGTAYADGIGFVLLPPLSSGRQSFSPDASLYVGSHPGNRMRFIEGAPVFAVEVRSEEDYGPAAELEMQAKRADYFEAGTKVVWDVDPLARTISSYRHDQPDAPTVFRAGERASAEPALAGLSILVDEVFPAP
ncbi:MAG TPA: Uma2 family endonuclease [Pirellulaceae bacterium]|nr:Uma2 family endonuclease [Pirellulaceae bacterium]